MSTNQLYTIERDDYWRIYIHSFVTLFESTRKLELLCFIIAQIYEYCAWKANKDSNKNITLKSVVKLHEDDKEWKEMCSNLYNIRGKAVHSPFYLYNSKSDISELLSNVKFKQLVTEMFPDTSLLDPVFQLYSQCL